MPSGSGDPCIVRESAYDQGDPKLYYSLADVKADAGHRCQTDITVAAAALFAQGVGIYAVAIDAATARIPTATGWRTPWILWLPTPARSSSTGSAWP